MGIHPERKGGDVDGISTALAGSLGRKVATKTHEARAGATCRDPRRHGVEVFEFQGSGRVLPGRVEGQGSAGTLFNKEAAHGAAVEVGGVGWGRPDIARGHHIAYGRGKRLASGVDGGAAGPCPLKIV